MLVGLVALAIAEIAIEHNWLALVNVDVAPLARVTLVTGALEVANQIHALSGAVGRAGLRGALVNVNVAIFALEAGLSAVASVIVDEIHAGGVIIARISGAIVDVHLAVSALEAWLALTSVIRLVVVAFGIVLAWRVGAHIHRIEASFARVARRALAPIPIDLVHAGCIVETGIHETLVDVGFAMSALPAGRAVALVIVDLVHASGVIFAGTIEALVDVELARLALPAGRALTTEICPMIQAFGLVPARPIGAHVYGLQAAVAPEAGGAFAPEIVDQIETGPVVGARLELLATLVDVDGARLATVTGRTEAEIVSTKSTVQTVRVLCASELDFWLDDSELWRAGLLRSAPVLE